MPAQDPIQNAEKIIEAFGGLRPMSAKTGVAVTTIQGWKKRGVIPAARKSAILKAAQNNDIDLSSFLDDAPKPEVKTEQADPVVVEKVEEVAVEPEESHEEVSEDLASEESEKSEQGEDTAEVSATVVEPQPKVESPVQPKPQPETQTQKQAQAQPQPKAFTEIAQKTESRAVFKSVGIAAAIILLLGAGVTAMLWPEYEEFGSHGKRLSDVETDLHALKKQQSMFKGLVPENWDKQLEELKQQAESARDMVNQTVADVKRATQDISKIDQHEIEKRMKSLQGYVSEMTGEQSIYAMMARLDQMRSDYTGNKTLDQAGQDLLALFQTTSSEDMAEPEQANSLLEQARSQSAALGQTFENVPQSELKAAAMLFALTQLRASLNREQEPFQEDLALLMNMVGEEDPELVASINKLAPYSESGLMSLTGVQQEFRSIAGEVVVESLKGENVSIGDKFSARMNSLLQIEKDGELVTGTKTQATVTKADNYLQSGQYSEALTLLKSNLNNKELAPLRPWMKKVEGVLASRDVKQALEQAIELNSGMGYLGGSSILQP